MIPGRVRARSTDCISADVHYAEPLVVGEVKFGKSLYVHNANQFRSRMPNMPGRTYP